MYFFDGIYTCQRGILLLLDLKELNRVTQSPLWEAGLIDMLITRPDVRPGFKNKSLAIALKLCEQLNSIYLSHVTEKYLCPFSYVKLITFIELLLCALRIPPQVMLIKTVERKYEYFVHLPNEEPKSQYGYVIPVQDHFVRKEYRQDLNPGILTLEPVCLGTI